jgi:hypothetical protein
MNLVEEFKNNVLHHDDPFVIEDVLLTCYYNFDQYGTLYFTQMPYGNAKMIFSICREDNNKDNAWKMPKLFAMVNNGIFIFSSLYDDLKEFKNDASFIMTNDYRSVMEDMANNNLIPKYIEHFKSTKSMDAENDYIEKQALRLARTIILENQTPYYLKEKLFLHLTDSDIIELIAENTTLEQLVQSRVNEDNIMVVQRNKIINDTARNLISAGPDTVTKPWEREMAAALLEENNDEVYVKINSKTYNKSYRFGVSYLYSALKEQSSIKTKWKNLPEFQCEDIVQIFRTSTYSDTVIYEK